MPEIQLGAHTIRSHGMQVARLHMHDWLILLLLVVIEVVLNVIEPFHRFVGEGMLEDLKYPLQDNTVPLWAVPVLLYLKHFADCSEPFVAFGFSSGNVNCFTFLFFCRSLQFYCLLPL